MSLSDDLKETEADKNHTPDIEVGHAVTQGAYAEDSEAWHQARQRGIGGSDAAKVLGLQPYGETRVDLWRQKTGRAESKVGNAGVRFGTLVEPYIRQWLEARARDTTAIYGQFSGLIDYPDQLHHPDYPWAKGHIDGLIVSGQSADAGVEIKNSSTPHGDSTYDWPDGVMAYHYPQVQHYMAVTGLPRWWYIYWVPPADREFTRLTANHHVEDKDDYLLWVVDQGEITIREVERDESYIDRLIGAERDFWRDHIEPDTEPDEWRPDGEVDVDDPELEDLLDRYGRAHAVLKSNNPSGHAESIKGDVKAEIKQRASILAADREGGRPKKIWVNEKDYVLWHAGYEDWQAKPAERPASLDSSESASSKNQSSGDATSEPPPIDLGF